MSRRPTKSPGDTAAPAIRRQGLRPLAAMAPALTDPHLRRRGFVEGRIVRDWAAIVGPDLAAITAPDSLKFPRARRDGGTLRLRVGSGRALEVQHRLPQLVERVNAHFGWRAVERIALVQGPLPKRPGPARPAEAPLSEQQRSALAGRVAGIRDCDLRARLVALGERVAARSRSTQE